VTTSGGAIFNVTNAVPGSTLSGTSFNGALNIVSSGTLNVLNSSLAGTATVRGTLKLSGAWQSTAAIDYAGGMLELGGSFSAGALANATGNSSSTVILTGAMNNTGTTLALDASTPFWDVRGGTVTGGAITTPANSNRLAFNSGTTGTSTLDGVSVTGPFALVDGVLRVTGGTTMSGPARILGGNAMLAIEGSATYNGQIAFETSGSDVGRVSIDPGATLTLGPSAIVRGNNGSIGDSYQAGAGTTLVNQGLISADVSAKTITVSAGTFSNQGIIEAKQGGQLVVLNASGPLGTARVLNANSSMTLGGSYTISTPLTVASGATLTLGGAWASSSVIDAPGATVNLGGTFSTAGIGTINRAGGTVNLTGTLDNTGQTLTLNSATGPWVLRGGTVQGGTVNLLDGIVLSGTQGSAPGHLSGVVLNGDINLQSGEIIAEQGTSINGTVNFVSGTLNAAGNQSIASGVFSFNGTGAPYGMLRVQNGANPATLTLGSGVTVRGGAGYLGNTFGQPDNDTIVNQGLISANVSGRELAIRSNVFQNQGTLEAINGGVITMGEPGGNTAWSNTGLIRLNNGTLNMAGTFTVSSLGSFQQTNGSVNILGTLNNTGNTLTLNAATGPWNLKGGTILGGTVALSGGVRLGVLPLGSAFSTLDGVTVNGGVDIHDGGLRFINGASFSGDVVMQGGLLALPTGSVVTQPVLFNGTGGVPGNQSVANIYPSATSGTASLTIAPGTLVHGWGGRLGDGYLQAAVDSIVNQGTIRADVQPTPNSESLGITIHPDFFQNAGLIETTNNGYVQIGLPYWNSLGCSWGNSGIINAQSGAVFLGGQVTTAGLGTIRHGATGQVVVTADVDNRNQTLTIGTETNITSFMGRLWGGALTVPAGFSPAFNGLFDGVVINGDITATGNFINGLSVNGSVTIPGNFRGIGDNTVQNGTFILTGGGTSLGSDTGTSTLTLAPGVVVRGQGAVGPGNLVNNGLISADGGQLSFNGVNAFTNGASGVLEAVNGGSLTTAGTWTNFGTARALSGGFLNLGGTFSSSGGTILNSGGTVSITGTLNNQNSQFTIGGTTGDIILRGTIAGGTVDSTSGGRLIIPNQGGVRTLNGVTLNADCDLAGPLAQVVSGLTLNGTMTTSFNGITRLTFNSPNSVLGGTGVLALTGPSAASSHRLDLSNNGTLTVGPGVTIRGGNATLADPNGVGPGTLINQGVIRADVSGQTLSIGANTFTNSGTLQVANGGTLNIGGRLLTDPSTLPVRNWSSTGLIQLSSGTLNLGGTFLASGLAGLQRTGGVVQLEGTMDNTGNTLTLNGAGQSIVMTGAGYSAGLYRGGTIRNGIVNLMNGATLTTNPTFSGVLDGAVLNGNLTVGGAFYVHNGGTINGDITLLPSSELGLHPPVAPFPRVDLNQGTLTFAGGASGAAAIVSGNVRLGPGYVVQGGRGQFPGPVENQGLIWANLAGQPISVSNFSNSGTLRVSNGSTLSLAGQWVNTGVLDVQNGSLQLAGFYSTSGLGTLQLGSGSSVSLGGYLDNTGSTLTLNGPPGSWTANAANIRGGTLAVPAGTLLNFVQNASTLENVNVVGDMVLSSTSGVLNVRGALAMNGSLSVAGPGSRLHFPLANSVLTSGTVYFDPALGGPARQLTTGYSLVIEPAAWVHGGNAEIQTGNLQTIVNRGRISADVPGEVITIYTTRFQNEGILETANGGILNFFPVPLGGGGGVVLTNDGVFDPGAGAISLAGYSQSLSGTLIARLDGVSSYTRLNVAGTLELDGTLRVLLSGEFQPWPGLSFRIIDASGALASGAFTSLSLPSLGQGYSWDTSALTSGGVITVVPAPGAAFALGLGVVVVVPRRRRRRMEAHR
jgi:hypothetical protein